MMKEPGKRARPDPAATSLLMLAGNERMVRRAHLGLDKAMEEMTGSADVLATFLKNHADAAEPLARGLGTEADVIRQRAEAIGPTSEPPADPPRLPPNKQEALDRLRSEAEWKAPWSAPVTRAMQEARDEATTDGREIYSVGEMMAALLASDCEARMLLLEFGPASTLDRAVRELKGRKTQEVDFMVEFQKNMKSMLDAAWPKLMEEAKQMSADGSTQRDPNALKEEHYAKDPAYYDAPVDLAKRLREPVPDARYRNTLLGGICLHAAENEARRRSAPSVRLDHMVYVLLQDGTDTAEFLDGLKVDRIAWRRRLDEALPYYPEGPRWPANARDLGMSIPDPGETHLKKEVPDFLDVSSLSKEERGEYFERKASERNFTDLAFLVQVPTEDASVGHQLFQEANISQDAIRAAVRSKETGDPEWYLRKPNLAEQLRDSGMATSLNMLLSERRCFEAAEFEARTRWAPSITLDHLLLALLGDGTDTSAFVESMGIDRKSLLQEIDRTCPRYSSGPYFPERDRSSMLGLAAFGILAKRRFSDLLAIYELLNDPLSDSTAAGRVGLRLLIDRGVTLDNVRAFLSSLGVDISEYENG
ncbi:MAG: hypothetical protein HZC36_02435 [Armatimonadetes bacterium]|nr:hypothetical protein [Armatimonadota bacterium]